MNACACLGPINGEPYCRCRMINLGIKTPKDYEPSQEAKDALAKVMAKYLKDMNDNKNNS